MRVSSPSYFVLGICLSMVGCADGAAADNASSVREQSAALSADGVSRIRVKSIATADGVSGFLGWYDTQLGIDCSFRSDYRDTTNKVRCWPTQIGTFREDADGAHYWADGACTKPVLNISHDPSTADIAIAHSYIQFYLTGKLYSAKAYTGPLYLSWDSEPCQPRGEARPGAFYEKGEAVPPSIFAEGQITLQ